MTASVCAVRQQTLGVGRSSSVPIATKGVSVGSSFGATDYRDGLAAWRVAGNSGPEQPSVIGFPAHAVFVQKFRAIFEMHRVVVVPIPAPDKTVLLKNAHDFDRDVVSPSGFVRVWCPPPVIRKNGC